MSERPTAEQLEGMLRHDAQAALRGAIDLLQVRGADRQSPAYQNLLLIKGAAQARVGQTEDGARLIRQVIAWASANGQTALLARAHRRMSALFRRVGDPALMLEHAVTAVDLLDDSTPDDGAGRPSARPRGRSGCRRVVRRSRSAATKRPRSWPTAAGTGTCARRCSTTWPTRSTRPGLRRRPSPRPSGCASSPSWTAARWSRTTSTPWRVRTPRSVAWRTPWRSWRRSATPSPTARTATAW